MLAKRRVQGGFLLRRQSAEAEAFARGDPRGGSTTIFAEFSELEKRVTFIKQAPGLAAGVEKHPEVSTLR